MYSFILFNKSDTGIYIYVRQFSTYGDSMFGCLTFADSTFGNLTFIT